MFSVTDDDDEDLFGIEESSKALHSLVEDEDALEATDAGFMVGSAHSNSSMGSEDSGNWAGSVGRVTDAGFMVRTAHSMLSQTLDSWLDKYTLGTHPRTATTLGRGSIKSCEGRGIND